MGHTYVRCKKPVADENDGGDQGFGGGGDTFGADEPTFGGQDASFDAGAPSGDWAGGASDKPPAMSAW